MKSSRISGLDRAIRYYFRMAERYVAMVLIGSFLLAAYNRLINGGGLGFQDIVQQVPKTIAMLTAVILFIIGLADMQTWHSMLVSFGCRRRNIYLGSMFMNLLMIGECLLLYELFSVLFLHDANVWTLPYLAALYLATEGVAQLVGAAVAKWGKFIYIIFTITIVLIGIVVVAVAINVYGDADSTGTYDLWITKLSGPSLKWGTLLMGGAICVVANAVFYRILRKFEVRA